MEVDNVSLPDFPAKNKARRRIGPMYDIIIGDKINKIIEEVGCTVLSDPIGDRLPQTLRFAYVRAAIQLLSEELVKYCNLSPRYSDNPLAILSRGAAETLVEISYGINNRPEIQDQLLQQLRRFLSSIAWSAPERIAALHRYLYHSFLRQNGIALEQNEARLQREETQPE